MNIVNYRSAFAPTNVVTGVTFFMVTMSFERTHVSSIQSEMDLNQPG
jgi:hypothetical protein